MKQNLRKPSETRRFKFGKVDLVDLGDTTVGRMTLKPGWKWSKSVKPIVKTESCQSHHVGYAVSGKMKVVSDDGTTIDVGPGDAYEIMPGHDAWVVGKGTFVGLEFKSAAGYAKPK